MKRRSDHSAVLAGSAIFFVLLAAGPIARAGLLRMESETLSSLRNGEDFKTELPAYEFFGANYSNDARDFELNADLGVFADPLKSKNDFNLYLLNLSYTPVTDRLTFFAGRNFDVQHTIRTNSVDTVGLDYWLLEKEVKLSTFYGKERKVELTGETLPSATIGGVSAQYTSSSMFPLLAKGKFQYRQFPRDSAHPELTTQWSADKSFPGAWSPEYLLDSEINIKTGIFNRAETGFDFYPTTRTAFRWRVLTYDVRPEDGIEQPIFSIFSQGRLYEGSAQYEYQFSKELSASISGAYDNYLLLKSLNIRKDGVKGEADARYTLGYFSATPALYYFNSFGGSVVGGRLMLGQKFTDRIELMAGGELTYYDKITSSKRAAVSTIGELNIWFLDRFKFTGGAEFNSNNLLKEDWRALGKLVYLLWAES